MLAVIPAAGIGKRLRPHTLNKPKALLPVAGKPILAHIVDDLSAAGIDRFVLIVGYYSEAVRAWFARERPELAITFVEQRQRLGLGHAVWTARAAVGDEPFFCILGDTILKADYAALLGSQTSVIAVREVADPRRFGVVEVENGRVIRCVEKPSVPASNLAIVGAYLFRNAAALWQALDRVVAQDIRTKNEYQLTDALQFMIDAGEQCAAVPVTDWYDCGKADAWLETNRVLLQQTGGTEPSTAIVPPCYVAADASVERSRIGPYVAIGSGTHLRDCVLSNCVVGADSVLSGCRLVDSLVGDRCRIADLSGTINIGDFGEVEGRTEQDR